MMHGVHCGRWGTPATRLSPVRFRVGPLDKIPLRTLRQRPIHRVMSIAALSSGLHGVRQGTRSLARAAADVYRAATIPPGPLSGGGQLGAGSGIQPPAQPDLATALSEVLVARQATRANLVTVRTAAEAYREVTDLV